MHNYTFQWPDNGHDAQAQILQKSITQDSLAHAYLFYGPEGIGKKELASVFVASLLCSDEQLRPCGSCENCRSISENVYPDLHWVNPESDTSSISIDQIRSLKRLLHFRSVSSKPKIALITGAESMTLLAANALLKVLEEPPQGVILVLIAHSLRAIPATVLSRCQLLRCRTISDRALRGILESLSDDSDLKDMAASLASGRTRYAREFLITGLSPYHTQTEAIFQLIESPLLTRLLQTSELARYQSAEQTRLDAEGGGKQADLSLDSLESVVRDILLVRAGVPSVVHRSYRERLMRIAESIPLREVYRMLDGIADLRQRLATYAHAQLAWEHFFINS
jgi:DNA polymerase-3 subunit delta'